MERETKLAVGWGSEEFGKAETNMTPGGESTGCCNFCADTGIPMQWGEKSSYLGLEEGTRCGGGGCARLEICQKEGGKETVNR